MNITTLRQNISRGRFALNPYNSVRNYFLGVDAHYSSGKLMYAWTSRNWITDVSEYPVAPDTVAGMYLSHLSMQNHPLAAALGGHCGYKIGAVGAFGETCLYGPLFGRFIAEANRSTLSAGSIQMHQIEPEFAVKMSKNLPARRDGRLHTLQEVWAAVEDVAISVECCGRRATPEVLAQTTKLGRAQDALSAGGLVIGTRIPISSLEEAQALSRCATELYVNGVKVVEGSGAACPDGGPVHALVWLANHLNSRGLELRKDMLVATGQTCVYRNFKVGDHITATFGELGKVEMVIAP